MNARIVSLSVLVLVLAARPSHGQGWSSSATTSAFNRQLWTEASTFNMWRGLHTGRGALVAGGAYAWGEPAARHATLIASGEARRAFVDSSAASDILGAGVTLLYRFDEEQNAVWTSFDALAYPDDDETRSSTEVAVGARLLVPNWLPERNPTFFVEARRDLKRHEATTARAVFRFDYAIPGGPGLIVDAGHTWSGTPRGAERGSIAFGSQAAELTVRALFQNGPPPGSHGTRSLEPYIATFWSGRNEDRFIVNVGVRVSLGY